MTSACTAGRHGTRAAYVAGCRCPDARKANREYAHYRKQRTAQAAFGAAVPFTVPVTDTRSIIDQLRGTGWTLRRIEAETGIGRDHLSRIYGSTGRPLNRVRWSTHQKLAALLDRDPIVAGGALVDAYPTWQRVRGLIALGYSKTWIAGQLGIGRALQLGEYVVTARNAEKVRVLVDRYGATPGPSLRARSYAAGRGWTPDLIWQADADADPSLDGPVLDEVAIERACDGEQVHLTRAERLEAVRRLATRGWLTSQIATCLHLNGQVTSALLAQVAQESCPTTVTVDDLEETG
jgi:hypothetical protein